jgi:AAA domain
MAPLILSAAERLAELRGPKLVILGRPGVGKTSLLRTVSPQTLATTLFIDAEAGDLCVADLPVASIRPQTWPDFQDIGCALSGGPNPAVAPGAPYGEAHYRKVMTDENLARLADYTLLFLDSLSEFSRRCRLYAEQQPEAFTDRGKKDLRAVYGLVGRELPAFLQQLQHVRSRTVIMTAVLEKATDDFNTPVWRPQIEGQRTANVLPAIVDEVLTLEFVDFGDHKPVRCLICNEPNPWGLPAKDRSGKLDQIEPPDLTKLLAKLTPAQAPKQENAGENTGESHD